MREAKCKLYSSNVSQIDHFQSEREGWSCLLDDFGELSVENEPSTERENDRSSIAEFIESFVNKLIIANMSHDVVNDVIEYSKVLVHKSAPAAMNKESMRRMKSKKDAEVILDSNEEFVTSCLNKFNTRYRRKKHFTNSPQYVAPTTISAGGSQTFQYVSILETLKTLFANKCFRVMYFTYNNNHECRENEYERYCCGRNYKENNFFQSNNTNIQIQIFYNDVQLTSPLKTKPHKICAIYFIIRNLPPEYVSKLDTMYLVALCDSDIVKKYGCNSVLEHLVRELQILETDGISIDNEKK